MRTLHVPLNGMRQHHGQHKQARGLIEAWRDDFNHHRPTGASTGSPRGSITNGRKRTKPRTELTYKCGLQGELVTTAILDPMLHHSYVVTIRSESDRRREDRTDFQPRMEVSSSLGRRGISS